MGNPDSDGLIVGNRDVHQRRFPFLFKVITL